MQDRCMRISCARCLWQDLLGSCKSTCARSVCADLLCKISLSGSLHQNPVGTLVYEDLLRKVFKISSAESCRSTCARSVYEDLLCMMSVSGSPRIL